MLVYVLLYRLTKIRVSICLATGVDISTRSVHAVLLDNDPLKTVTLTLTLTLTLWFQARSHALCVSLESS